MKKFHPVNLKYKQINLEELKSNLKEAITGWLEVYNEEIGKKISAPERNYAKYLS